MIREVAMFKVYCDGCNREAEDSCEFYAWADKEQAVENAECDGWVEQDDKHYCPKCFCVDCQKPGKPCDGETAQ